MYSGADFNAKATKLAYEWSPNVGSAHVAIGDQITAPDKHWPIVSNHSFRVLLWTKYFGSDVWSKLKFKDLNCRYDNCDLTADRRLLSASDAVMFHWRDIDPKDVPNYHMSDQKWILYNWESPHNTPEELIETLADDIDWTLTYRVDSDIYSPYGLISKCDNQWHNEDIFDIKSKSVAWIVSHCATQSKREDVVKELKKYIDVDVYGNCGQYQCKWDKSCFEMIANTYKFYLSFENSVSFTKFTLCLATNY